MWNRIINIDLKISLENFNSTTKQKEKSKKYLFPKDSETNSILPLS